MKGLIKPHELPDFLKEPPGPFKENEYIKKQAYGSSPSRGSKWGAREQRIIEEYESYFKGKILVVGCNDGLDLLHLKSKGFDCEGIDIDKTKLQTALKDNLKVHFAFQEGMPFKDKSFDTIFSCHTLEHSYNAKKALKEYQRVASRAIVIVPIEEGKKPNKVHCSLFENKEEFTNLFKDKGKILVSKPFYDLQEQYIIIIDFKE